MRYDGNEHATNFAQNLGDLAGHDIVLMHMANAAERERPKADPETENSVPRRWFSAILQRLDGLLGRGAKGLQARACRRTAFRSAPMTHGGADLSGASGVAGDIGHVEADDRVDRALASDVTLIEWLEQRPQTSLAA